MRKIDLTPETEILEDQKPDTQAILLRNRIYRSCLIAITLSYCVWVLSLPLFPTMDGPVHLYYMHVLSALLQKGPSVYKNYYVIKSVLPPYSFYYYLEILLSTIVPALVADKLVICIFFVLFVSGFRYLATAIGPNGELMTLLATPLLLNWPLGKGFVNFCLAVALAMWAVGLWLRVAGRAGHRRKILFVALAYLTMLTHPIPLLFILGFGFAELSVRCLRHIRSRDKEQDRSTYLRQDAFYLLLAAGTLLYVKLFTVSNMLQQTETPKPTIHDFADNAWAYLFQYSLDVFRGDAASVTVYRIAIFLILVVPLGIAMWQTLRHIRLGVWRTGDTWLALSLGMILAMPFVPLEMNHSYSFAYRLVLVVWLAGIAAGSVLPRSTRAFGGAVVLFSLGCNALILTLAHERITPVAREIAQAALVGQEGDGQAGPGLLLNEYKPVKTLNYDPYFWAGAHYFRAHDAVLYDSPWLNNPIIPVGAVASFPNGKLEDMAMERPLYLRDLMASSPEIRDFVLRKVSFVVIPHGLGAEAKESNAILASDPRGGWSCESRGWFDLCAQTHSTASN
jgi:hypothetical protein